MILDIDITVERPFRLRLTGWALAWGFMCLLAMLSVAHAQTYPKLTGRVVDAAALLDPQQEAVLTQQLEALETQSRRQLVVVTVPDLQGNDIADYGYQLGRAWGIGDKERNDGALLIVAPNERKVRIEVGYGLEGIMTDAVSAQVIRNTIIPRFRDNDYPGGIQAGVDSVAQILTLPPDEAQAFAKAAEKQGSSGNGAMAIFWIVVLLFFVLPIILSSARGGKRHGRGRSGPVIIWGPDIGGSSGSSWGGGGGFGGGGSFGGGGGSFGGGGASGGW